MTSLAPLSRTRQVPPVPDRDRHVAETKSDDRPAGRMVAHRQLEHVRRDGENGASRSFARALAEHGRGEIGAQDPSAEPLLPREQCRDVEGASAQVDIEPLRVPRPGKLVNRAAAPRAVHVQAQDVVQ